MFLLIRCTLLASLALFFSSCTLLKTKLFAKKHASANREQRGDVFLGTVESVNPEKKFVLVRLDLKRAIPSGTKLDVRAVNGSRSTITVTPESKMNFLIADIAEGSPMVGDVVSLSSEAVAALTPASTPATVVAPPVGTAPAPLPKPAVDPVPGVLPEEASSLPPPVR